MNQNIESPELLMPAGNTMKLRYALAHGADAVYAGMPQYSLRARENDFNDEKIKQAIEYTQNLGKKFYLAANILPLNEKIPNFIKKLDSIIEAKPDALIMADPGMIYLVKERHPDQEIHLSVQANTMNWASAKFWYQNGIKRVIMSREVSIDEMREVRQRVPEIEVEAFVHGAICMAHSGRCLLSNYFNRRDANQGTCTNACRWNYKLYQKTTEVTDKTEEAEYKALEGEFYLQESGRPDNMMLVDEDEYGTYMMNAKDLMAIEYLKDLHEAGVSSFKIEGRTKSYYYLSWVTRMYRQAIDEMMRGKDFDPKFRSELLKVPHRGYSSAFLTGTHGAEIQRYESGVNDLHTHAFAGVVLKKEAKRILIEPKNRLELGDELELFSPDQNKSYSFSINRIVNESNEEISVVHGGSQNKVWLDCDFDFNSEFALISKRLKDRDAQGEKIEIKTVSGAVNE